MKRKGGISFDLIDWQHAMMIAGIRRGNGKYNPNRMYQGFANLSHKSARKSSINHQICEN